MPNKGDLKSSIKKQKTSLKEWTFKHIKQIHPHTMFPNSEIAKNFEIASNKIGYAINYGLGVIKTSAL